MTKNISFLDLRSIMLRHSNGYREAFDRVLESGWYILGKEVEQFEKSYAHYCEASHCVGVANGLDALILALKALDIGAGDEVIVPSNTYIATWLAVTHVGAVPVPVEPDINSYNIDPALIEAAITTRTKAILPVHLYGQAADIHAVTQIGRKHGLHVVEDAAQSHGARYQGRRIGAHSDIVCWSFYPGKNLGALGDGGAITTDNPQFAERIRTLRNYGSKSKYHNEIIGQNSRLDELQAAFLSARLGDLDGENARRRQIAAKYHSALSHTKLRIPEPGVEDSHVWHLYVVRYNQRDLLADRLAAQGIGTMIHYPVPPHLQPAYADLGLELGRLPIAERIHQEVLSLPISPTMTDEEVERVIQAVRSSLG